MNTLLRKTISWRTISTLTTLVLAYIITGSLEIAGALTVAEFFVKLLLYYLHEKLWIRYKKKKKMEKIANESYSEAYKRVIKGIEEAD